MFSILAQNRRRGWQNFEKKTASASASPVFFSQNFVTLVADFGPKLKTWSRQIMFYTKKQLSTPCIYLCFWRRLHQTASVIRSRSFTKLGLQPFPLLIHTTLTSLAKISQILAHFHVCILAHFHTPLILLSCYLSGLVIVLIDQYWSWQYFLSFMKNSEFSLNSLFFECDRLSL